MGTFLKDIGAKNHEKASQLGARGLERNRAGVSNRAEPAENRRAQRRHRLGRHTRNPASKSNGRLESGVDLFGRASRGSCAEPSGKIMRNKRRKRAFIAFGIVFLIFIHAAWATTRLRRVSRDTNFSQAKNVASFHKEVDKNSKWRETMETRVFSAEKVDVESLFAPVYPSELPTNLGSRNTRLMWLATEETQQVWRIAGCCRLQ